MFCYQRELQKAWILWNGKARTKKARCAFCLLSVTSQRFLNTWGVTWWGAVGGYHFKWRQFSDFLKCFQIKVIGNTPRSVSGPPRSWFILSWQDQREQWVPNHTHLFPRWITLKTLSDIPFQHLASLLCELTLTPASLIGVLGRVCK